MKKLFITLGVLIGVLTLAGSTTFAAFNQTGGSTYTLKGSVSSTATSITLSSFTEPGSGIPYTMTYLNSDIEYGTIAPQTNQNEFISFTGITQNSDGSATLTGVVRGLGRSYPYTASSTLRFAHAGQSQFILGNTPQFYNEFAKLRNDQTISGVWGFASLPTTSVVCVNANQFCNKQYIDTSVSVGAGPAGYTTPGIGFIATKAQIAAGTASTTFNAVVYPNLLTAQNSTSTCQVPGNFILVASSTTGRLDARCVATNGSVTYTGNNTFSGTTAFATTTVSTTTVNQLNVTAGNTTGLPRKIGLSTALTLVANTTATTSEFNYTVTGSTLGTSNYIRSRVYVSGFSQTGSFNNCPLKIEAGYGYSSTTAVVNALGGLNGAQGAGYIDILLAGAGTTGSQVLSVLFQATATSTNNNNATTSVSSYAQTSLAKDSTADQNLGLNIAFANAAVTCWILPTIATSEVLQ